MAEDGPGEGRPRLEAVPGLPAAEDGERLATDAELRGAIAGDSEQRRMRAALTSDPARDPMRRAFGLDV